MVIIHLLHEKKIPERPDQEPECDKVKDHIWNIMKKCWNYDPSQRPTCNDLWSEFTDAKVLDAPLEAVVQDENNHVLWEAMRTKSSFQVDYERVLGILCKVPNVPLHLHILSDLQ